MQLESFGARDEVVLAPPFGRPVAAAGQEPVQHRQVDRPFDIKLEPPPFEHGTERFRQAAFLPQSPEDQVRAEAAHGHGLGFAGGMGVEHRQALTMTQARTHQPIRLAALLQ